MDTVYGTKKYFQSLSGTSDIYRSQGIRAVSNDYTYQNTLGRRSTLGAYYHMSKQPSYTNDLSYNSQYTYNGWGVWRDGRNLAPSTFSAKTHHTHYQKTRSFSIILTTAAFIILLAVVSIAGLAFYFSSIKANMEDPIIGFEGSFRIAKGDLYSTGLKYNHTTTYKQKIEFYKRFVERALSDNNLQSLRTDIWGFGEGPLIKVNFRTFLDVRKLPQNIHNVEEYIKESLFLETTAVKSLYRSLRIDADSVEVKRILDEQVVKSASLFKEAQTPPTSQTQLEKRLMKKGNGSPGLVSRTSSTPRPRITSRPHSVEDEPDIDVENAPVIQGSFEGSFEITKTDADIAQKKTAPTKAYNNLPPVKAVTTYTYVKPKKPSIEKLTTVIPQHQTKTTRSTSTTTTATPSTTTTTTSSTSTTTTTTTTTTTPKPPSTTTATTTTTTQTPSTTSTTTTTTAFPQNNKKTIFPNQFTFPSISTPTPSLNVPVLDTNLFTSIPILDTQPWRPIHREVPEFLPGPPPAFPTKTIPTVNMPMIPEQRPFSDSIMPNRRIDEVELPFLPEKPSPPIPSPYDPYSPNFFGTPVRKPLLNSQNDDSDDMMLYHSFGNPVFMPGADGIEKLGAGASVQPHPLPVPLIDDVVVPPFKPINPTLGTNDKLPFQIETGDENFEHLGDGVIVKKHNKTSANDKPSEKPAVEETTEEPNTDVAEISENEEITEIPQVPTSDSSLKQTPHSELADTLGELFRDLLNLPKEEFNATKVKNTTTDVSPSSTTTEETPELREDPENEDAELEANQETEDETTTTTAKPNFLNLKDIILKRNQAANQTRKYPTETIPSTLKTPIPTTKSTAHVTPTIPATAKAPAPSQPATTKRNHIRPTLFSKPVAMLNDSILFPSNSKWEFVNSSSTGNLEHTGNMRKVFNKTLQAWVSEDVGRRENITLNDIKVRINNATNIQDISLIFDTLASKLGITPSVSTKMPPFSHNKFKQSQAEEARLKATTSSVPTTRRSTSTTPKTMTASSTTTTTTTTPKPVTTTKFFDLIPPLLRDDEPFIKPMSSFMEESSSEGIGAAIPVVGEAEVEVIDPTKYEEMLKSSRFDDITTESSPKLVTLLPVRSNSGIRTYRPLEEARHSGDSTVKDIASPTVATETSKNRKSPTPSVGLHHGLLTQKTKTQSRRFPPAEAIVKGGIKVSS